MQDLRGGFPGFLSKSKPTIVEGIAHLLIRDETKYSEQNIKMMTQMMGVEIVRPDLSRPFSAEEYEQLPQRYKDMLEKNGTCFEAIPFFSAAIKPFSSNS
jgi:hypothetical protein